MASHHRAIVTDAIARVEMERGQICVCSHRPAAGAEMCIRAETVHRTVATTH